MRFNCYNASKRWQRHMRRMRNIWAHVYPKLCTSSVREKSRLIPIFYAQSKQKKRERATGTTWCTWCLRQAAVNCFSPAHASPLRALSLFFFSALSFNLLHEKCFIVARATASANLAAFNKLWLHSPRPFAASCHSTRVVLIAHCCLGFWSSPFFVFHLRLRIESSCRVSGVRCVFVAMPAKFFPPENAASVTLFFHYLSPSLALLSLCTFYKFSIAHNAAQKGKYHWAQKMSFNA